MKNNSATLPNSEMLKRMQRIRGELLAIGAAATAAVDKAGRGTKNDLVNEWKQQSLNYWRCIEIPACLAALTSTPVPSGPVLDMGSPKLAALWMAKHLPENQTNACDISDYFVEDFDEICRAAGIPGVESVVFDARSIPYPSGSVAAAVSISVVEHIPGDGDSVALAEIGRVVALGGRIVLSVPFWKESLTEYAHSGQLYWESFSDGTEKTVFYQRRYSYQDLFDRLIRPSGRSLKVLHLISERPAFSQWGSSINGQLAENWQYLKDTTLTRTANRFAKVFPSLPQWIHRYYSHRLHRFTADLLDDQVMAAVLVLE